jgi:hypothetical protein
MDTGAPVGPEGVGAVLFLSHEGDRVDLRWDGSRALLAGEHFHLLKARDNAEDSFFASNPEGDLSLGSQDTDVTSRLQFFDLRVADRCESLSADEFPASY